MHSQVAAKTRAGANDAPYAKNIILHCAKVVRTVNQYRPHSDRFAYRLTQTLIFLALLRAFIRRRCISINDSEIWTEIFYLVFGELPKSINDSRWEMLMHDPHKQTHGLYSGLNLSLFFLKVIRKKN